MVKKIGTNGPDTLDGTDDDDFLFGLGGNDTLNSFGGVDSVDNLTGGFGADRLNGGAGHDRANYDDSKEGVTVLLGGSSNGSGAGGTAEGDILVSIENVTGSLFDDFIIGDNGQNLIDGFGGQDVLAGLGGDDVLGGSGTLEGGTGEDLLIGRLSNDTLRGEDDDDKLVGGEGADVLDGGNGIDTAIYEGDVGVIVALGGSLPGSGAGGEAEGDTLISIENVTGSFESDILLGDDNANRLRGLDGDDQFDGGGGADLLEGDIGNDTLFGGDGNDRLSGGFDADHHDGGAGIDGAEYFASNAGVSVNLTANTASGGHAAGDTFVGIENIEGSAFDDTIVGDGGANEFFGSAGKDTLKGAGGADTLFGSLQDDLLVGGAGADILDGGSGVDNMIGGTDDDLYIVDNAGDVVDESLLGGSGVDTVESKTTFSLSSSTVKANVENLTLTGGAGVNAIGNALNNTIIGNSGNNTINGNSGADRMAGKGGSDHYVVNEVGDVVDESLAGSGGVDDILSFVSLSLSGPNVLGSVEDLRLINGTSPLNATGNALANTLVGNNGINVITGAAGNDILTGKGGADFFVFTTPLNAATNVDTITDFNVAQDTMRLENRFFTGLANGTLAASAFSIGAAAADASDRIVYNDDTGALFFDKDGTGAAASVRFATLEDGPAMTNVDFLVI